MVKKNIFAVALYYKVDGKWVCPPVLVGKEALQLVELHSKNSRGAKLFVGTFEEVRKFVQETLGL